MHDSCNESLRTCRFDQIRYEPFSFIPRSLFGEQRLRHIVMCSVNYDSCNLNEFTGNVWVDSIEVEFMRRKLIEFFSSAFRYHSFISFIEFSCCSRRSKDKLIVNGDERSNEKKRRIRTKPWLSITCLVRIWRDRHWIIIIINSIIMLAVQCWRGVWLRLASLSLCVYCQFSIVSYATS